MSRDPRLRRRPVAGPALLRVLPVALLLAGTAGCGPYQDTKAGSVETKRQVVGLCHYPASLEEMYAVSDIQPPVACDTPHRTETVSVKPLPTAVAKLKQRPGPEQLQVLLTGLCTMDELHNYMGLTERDAITGLSMWARTNTREEWEHGERTLRCEAVPTGKTPGEGPLLTVSLYNIMATPASATVRQCFDAHIELTCDQPHASESVNAWLKLPAEEDDLTRGEVKAAELCRPYIEEFLGAKLADRPDLLARPRMPRPIDWWTDKDRTVKCAVGPADPQQKVTATLRGGLKGSA